VVSRAGASARAVKRRGREVFFAERPGYAHEFTECEGGGGDEEAPGEE